ncbi:MAG: hypothetical protein DRR08_07545 [Candidatus Parabeggiatoa sp. nov. 2]|nr:MAG: hypothetical protein B6247_03500 [Beggiatoa sp. 4572_84]RKZ61890.1 MAG: hypothetical protein DRR08_07545 [Gammaproteobacteria bacterium]
MAGVQTEGVQTLVWQESVWQGTKASALDDCFFNKIVTKLKLWIPSAKAKALDSNCQSFSFGLQLPN